jgi:predicted aspartyl protease
MQSLRILLVVEESLFKALVDTGIILTVVPRRVAEELQLPVIGRRRVAVAKGIAELDGRKAYTHTGIRLC